jgi:hypothetical protein
MLPTRLSTIRIPCVAALAALLLSSQALAGGTPEHTLVIDLSPFTPPGVVGEVLGVGTQQGEVIGARMDVVFVSNEAGPWSMAASFEGFPTHGAVGFHSDVEGWSGTGTFSTVILSDSFNGTLVIPDEVPFYTWFVSFAGGAPFTLPGGGIGVGPMDGHFETLRLTLTLAPCPFGDPRAPWADAGGALAGTTGEPAFSGSGSLCSGEPLTLHLEHALPGGTSNLVAGFSLANAAFKGGILVPTPDLILYGLPVDAFGVLDLLLSWPPGAPSGFTFWMQHWIADAAGPAGFAASNGLSGTTP